MKFTTSTILSASALVAAATAAPSSGTTYSLKVKSTNKAISGSVLTLKNEDATSEPNVLGVWSTGEPRSAYTFTFSVSDTNNKLYELKGVTGKTYLILSGDPVAMAFADVPLGADPTVADGEVLYNNRFLVSEQQGQMILIQAERYASADGDLIGAGSWRACKGDSEVDYQIFWYDGLSPLPIKDCEGISLEVAEASGTTPSGFITGVPAPTDSPTGFITGVPALTDSPTGFITGVPAPTTSGNASSTRATATPSPFNGAGSHLSMAGGLVSFVFGVIAFVV